MWDPSGRDGAAGGGEGRGGTLPKGEGENRERGVRGAAPQPRGIKGRGYLRGPAARPAGRQADREAGTQAGRPSEETGGGASGATSRSPPAAAGVSPRPPPRHVAPGGSLLLGGTVAVLVAVGASGPGGQPAGRPPPSPNFPLAVPGGAAAARHDGEKSGEAGARLQAPGAASAGAQRAAGAGVPGGRVVERGAGQLPQRAALRQEAALRLPRGARGHARRHRHLLLAQQRGATRGLHLPAAAAAAQVRPAGTRDPRHRLPRRRHLHQGCLPAGGGETGGERRARGCRGAQHRRRAGCALARRGLGTEGGRGGGSGVLGCDGSVCGVLCCGNVVLRVVRGVS